MSRLNPTTTPSIRELTSDQLDPFSLAPMRVEEELICLLSAGFPTSNRQVVEKVRRVKDSQITRIVRMPDSGLPFARLSLTCVESLW